MPPKVENKPLEPEIEEIEAEEVILSTERPLPLTSQPIVKPPIFTKTTPPPSPPKLPVTTQKRSYRIYLYGVFIALAVGIGYKYLQFQKLGTAYSLTDNVAVRFEPNSASKMSAGLFMFGKWLDRKGNELDKQSSVRLLSPEPEKGYYKVTAGGAPFLDYLFNNSFYVYAKFVTTDSSEYNTYRRIFKNLDNDYYELKNLEFAYRKIIYNALSSGTLEGLSIAATCEDKYAVTSNKKPLSIGHFRLADKGQYYVVVRLSDNNYYFIEANNNYEIENIEPVTFYYDTTKYDNIYTMEGRFTNQGSYFEWESCDGTYKAQSSGMDLSSFTIE